MCSPTGSKKTLWHAFWLVPFLHGLIQVVPTTVGALLPTRARGLDEETHKVALAIADTCQRSSFWSACAGKVIPNDTLAKCVSILRRTALHSSEILYMCICSKN